MIKRKIFLKCLSHGVIHKIYKYIYNKYLYIIYTYRIIEKLLRPLGSCITGCISGLGMPLGIVTPSPLPVPGSAAGRSRSDETLLSGNDHSKGRITAHNLNAQLLLVYNMLTRGNWLLIPSFTQCFANTKVHTNWRRHKYLQKHQASSTKHV